MNKLRAFIGHSFADADSELVEKFLKQFKQISDFHTAFSWEHAQAAEPRILSEKVLSLIEDKNLFIGICTKKEMVINPTATSPLLLRPSYSKIENTQIRWKTSDWIIQEIGLAKGRRLDIILLLENGVQSPGGGLLGDVEYIPFDRETPEKSFGKILEMLKALSPQSATTQAASAKQPSSIESEAPEPPSGPLWTVPEPSWRREDYDRALFFTLIRDDEEGFEKINAAYLATEEGFHEEARAGWQARIEYLRIVLGKKGDIERLRQIAEENPDNAEVLRNLAKALGEYDATESAKTYEQAARKTSDRIQKQQLLGFAAEKYAEAGNLDQADTILEKLKAKSIGGDEIKLLRTMRAIAEATENNDALAAILERTVELAPSEVDRRFSLAYQHSQLGNEELALFHYLRIPVQDRSAIAWNNLGVALQALGLSEKAVKAYRRAEEMGETLAMSNLGNKLMSGGFTTEALAECNKALGIENYHQNVTSLLARLKELPDEEEDKEKNALEKAKPKIEFYRLLGRAISHPNALALAERWQGPKCALTLRLLGKNITLEGNYELPPNPLSSAFGILGVSPKPTKYYVTYKGEIDGHTIRGEVKRSSNRPKTLLDTSDIGDKVFMVIKDNLSEIEVMENPYSGSPTFYTLKALVAVDDGRT